MIPEFLDLALPLFSPKYISYLEFVRGYDSILSLGNCFDSYELLFLCVAVCLAMRNTVIVVQIDKLIECLKIRSSRHLLLFSPQQHFADCPCLCGDSQEQLSEIESDSLFFSHALRQLRRDQIVLISCGGRLSRER